MVRLARPAPGPGRVLATRGGGIAGTMIRLSAALRGHPNLSAHIAVSHHVDAQGTPWGIEGRPGGVGWVDLRGYLASPWTLINDEQVIPDAAGLAVAKTMEALIGTAYDWTAIVADAAESLRLHLPGWDPSWHGTVPGHVVCSSAAAYAYGKQQLARPPGDRGCTPAGWDTFILTRAWEAP